MIAKFRNRVDFSGIVNYAHNQKSGTKRARIIGHQGVCIVSNETIVDSFNTHLRRPDKNGRVHNISQPVKHISIAFSPEDSHLFPDNEDGDRYMAQLVNEWLHGMGIDNAQYIIARHFDKPHPHCHLVFSRIDLDGNVISNFNEHLRSAKLCREIKLRHGLTFGDSTGQKVHANRLRPEQRARLEIKTTALRAAELATSWTEFQCALEAEGIETSFSLNGSTGAIRGISFAKNGYRFAGSKLSKQKLTYAKLAAKFGKVPLEKIKMTDKAAYAVSSSSKSLFDTLFEQVEELPVSESPILTGKGEEPISIIPLSAIVTMLTAPAVIPSSGGGSTTNDLDWNDERRRRQEAIENQNIIRLSKRRR